MTLLAAFLALIACSACSHWAVWRRLDECEAKVDRLSESLEFIRADQLKLRRDVDRIDDKPARPADPSTYVATNYPKQPHEVWP